MKSKANEISSHNESVALLELCPDVSFINENLIRSDMTNMTQEMQILLEYGYRSDYLNNIKKENMLNLDEYFDLFMEETEPYADLCRDSLFASPEEIICTYESLFDEITERIARASINFEEDKNGLVYPYDMQNMVQLFPCFLFNYCDVLKKFEETTGFFIFNHTLDKKDIDVYNLKFYHLSRKPFINFSDSLILSLEIILESMFIDSHYTLLETPYSKEEYKATASESFLTKFGSVVK